MPLADDLSVLDHVRALISGPAARGPGAGWARMVRMVSLAYLAVQVGLPLRMPLVSRGEFIRTAEGYRWSWTMMLHSTSHWMKTADGRMPFELFSFMPVCPGRGVMPRWAYLLETHKHEEDANSLPIDVMFRGRHAAALRLFPRQLPQIIGPVT